MIIKFYEFLKIPEGRPIKFVGKYWRRFIDGRIISYIRKKKLPQEPLNKGKRSEKVIVSLTTFPARIDCVEFAVKSLMLQDYKPDRIILWLSNLQFTGEEQLPKSLLALKKYGLEIKFCDDDLRGHKKYFQPIIDQKEDELVITFDDDIIYPPNSISRLIKLHKKFPQAVIANRGYEITFDKSGKLCPHKKWKLLSRYGVKTPELLLHLSNGSGVLYPYNSLYKDVCDDKMIKKFALGIDDLWMSVMAILKGTPMVKSHYAFKTFTVYPGSQKYQLGLENMKNAENVDRYDVALGNMMEYYTDLKDKLSVGNK